MLIIWSSVTLVFGIHECFRLALTLTLSTECYSLALTLTLSTRVLFTGPNSVNRVLFTGWEALLYLPWICALWFNTCVCVFDAWGLGFLRSTWDSILQAFVISITICFKQWSIPKQLFNTPLYNPFPKLLLFVRKTVQLKSIVCRYWLPWVEHLWMMFSITVTPWP